MDIEQITAAKKNKGTKPRYSYRVFVSVARVIGLEGHTIAEEDERADNMPKRRITSPRVTTIEIAIKMMMIQVCPRRDAILERR